MFKYRTFPEVAGLKNYSNNLSVARPKGQKLTQNNV